MSPSIQTTSSSLNQTTSKPVQLFGPYKLIKTIGEGEFGKVKLAVHLQTVKRVAIKLIKKEVFQKNDKKSKLMKEINILKVMFLWFGQQTLNHPFIVTLLEVIENNSYIGMVLEYASGGELFEYIFKTKYLVELEAKKYFAQLISGVNYLHSRNIVHRDLKLENLLLDENGNLIITDFGFANYIDENFLQTSCGSPCYAAPELVVSTGYRGPPADIWSCGIILYAMLCGYLPFDDDPTNPDGENITVLYRYIINTVPIFPNYVPESPKSLIKSMLIPDPKDRATMLDIISHPWIESVRSLIYSSKFQNDLTHPLELNNPLNHQHNLHLDTDNLYPNSYTANSPNPYSYNSPNSPNPYPYNPPNSQFPNNSYPFNSPHSHSQHIPPHHYIEDNLPLEYFNTPSETSYTTDINTPIDFKPLNLALSTENLDIKSYSSKETFTVIESHKIYHSTSVKSIVPLVDHSLNDSTKEMPNSLFINNPDDSPVLDIFKAKNHKHDHESIPIVSHIQYETKESISIHESEHHERNDSQSTQFYDPLDSKNTSRENIINDINSVNDVDDTNDIDIINDINDIDAIDNEFASSELSYGTNNDHIVTMTPYPSPSPPYIPVTIPSPTLDPMPFSNLENTGHISSNTNLENEIPRIYIGKLDIPLNQHNNDPSLLNVFDPMYKRYLNEKQLPALPQEKQEETVPRFSLSANRFNYFKQRQEQEQNVGRKSFDVSNFFRRSKPNHKASIVKLKEESPDQSEFERLSRKSIALSRTSNATSFEASRYSSAIPFHKNTEGKPLKMKIHSGPIDRRAITNKDPMVLILDMQDYLTLNGYNVITETSKTYRLKVTRPHNIHHVNYNNIPDNTKTIPAKTGTGMSGNGMYNQNNNGNGMYNQNSNQMYNQNSNGNQMYNQNNNGMTGYEMNTVPGNEMNTKPTTGMNTIPGNGINFIEKLRLMTLYGSSWNKGYNGMENIKGESLKNSGSNKSKVNSTSKESIEIRFNIEVQKIKNIELYIVEFQRLKGDIWEFKDMYEHLIMNLPIDRKYE